LYRSVGGGAFQLVADITNTTAANHTDSNVTPGATLNDDALDQANYSYYVTFYDTDSELESRPTQRIGAISISDVNRRIRIDNIPQPPINDSDFNAVRIYRNTSGNTSDFRLVATLTDGQTTFIDNIPDADIIANQEIDLIGPKAENGTSLFDVVLRDGDVYSTPFEAGVLTFTGRKGDRTLAPKQLTIDAETTLGDLNVFMSQAFGIDTSSEVPGDPGAEISDGVMKFTSNLGIENALSVGLSGLTLTPAGSNTARSIGIDFNETEPSVNGAGSTTDFIVFDSLGIPLNVRITTVMEEKTSDSRTYRWYATSQDNEPADGSPSTAIGTGTITFDGNGRIISGDTASIAVQRTITGSQSPLEFELDFNQVSGLAVSNNLGESSSSMSMTRQDGFPPGSLTSFIITESGLIRGVFSNGTERQLGQMRMARFANNSGLQQIGDNVFTKGVNSGEPIEGNPGTAGLGALTAGAVELSNSDIGQNLIELILASTQYRGGTRVITAAQQLLDELMALRR
jgi:flagellar hook protein FlgE